MLITWGSGDRDQQAWQSLSVGLVIASVAILTIVEPPTLDVCHTFVAALTPERSARSLTPLRTTQSLTPLRSVEEVCE